LSREKAERLRARVEDLYQSHRISIAAYKQGQAEYRHELANYENQIAQLRGAMMEPEQLTTDPMEYWSIGVLEYRSIGVVE
jgi:hypothetical protein